VSAAARLADTEQGLVRVQDLRSVRSCPRGRRAMTPGPQPGSCGFESRRGCCLLLPVGETATPPASGAGDRWFESSRADLRGRGGAVLASLMSSRPRVRIPPALFDDGGVAQTARALGCRPRGHRFDSGRPRFHGDCGVAAAFGVVIPAAPVRIRPVALACGR
jgi:hypothetical protein